MNVEIRHLLKLTVSNRHSFSGSSREIYYSVSERYEASATTGQGDDYFVCPQERRHQLIDFQQSNVLAQTDMTACTKLEHRPLHLPRRIWICEPTVWAVAVTVFPKCRLITLNDPGMTAHNRSSRNQFSANCGSRWRYDTFDEHPKSRVYTERFLDTSPEIRQLTGLGEGGLNIDRWRGRGYWLEMCIQLLLQLRIAAGRA